MGCWERDCGCEEDDDSDDDEGDYWRPVKV